MSTPEQPSPIQQDDMPEIPLTQPAAAPDPLAEAQAEAADLKDKLLRTLAEMENLRRRTEREVADARSYGITAFARDMLTVADNLRRALDTLTDETRQSAGEAMKSLIDGIELTERDLNKTLERHGVKKREPMGEKFNPNFDQAMFEIPDESKPSGTVTQIIQPGYVIGERVLRPSMVGVTRGGPKATDKA